MKRMTKRLMCFLCSALMAIGALVTVYAEEINVKHKEEINVPLEFMNGEKMRETDAGKLPVIGDRKTGNLTIRYFDDSEETVPVTGAEFTIMQVATIGTEVMNSGAYIPLVEGLDFTHVESAIEYENAVIDAYKKNPELGYTKTLPIGKDGIATYRDIPTGAYIVREVKTARYHIRSIPFLVSVPEMHEDGTGWNFNVVANPKQILAGDLSATKETNGKISKEDKTYTLQLQLEAPGEFRASFPDGTEGFVKDGTRVPIKSGQTLTIYDLPAASSYKITELEENMRCVTTYKNKKGVIKAKTVRSVKIINDSTDFDTGVRDMPIVWMFGIAMTATLLVLLVASSNKKQEE